MKRAPPPSLPLPPPPAAGSPHYFALLYSPARLRPMLATLLALADEISAGAVHGADHSVAHVRLDWWRGEAERYARGEPQHPWLRALAQDRAGRRLQVQPLVEAAAIDLATRTLSGQPGTALHRAVFSVAGAALQPDAAADAAAPSVQRTLGDLGERVLELERFARAGRQSADAPAAPGAALEALRAQTRQIEPALQPPLAPLLVWAALAARHAERRTHRPRGKSRSALDAFADNMIAWSAARRAARGRFRID